MIMMQLEDTPIPSPQTTDSVRLFDLKLHSPLIIGHYGGCNTGDEAMLAGLLGAVAPNVRKRAAVVVKGAREGNLRSTYDTGMVPAEWGAVLRTLLRSDGLMLGGGTHFHDDYAIRRYLRHLRHMARITFLSVLAKLFGRKVFWLGMGFGPFYRWPTRWVTRLGLKFCDRVTVRDAESQREISGWISPKKLTLTFDLAALLVDESLRRAGQVAKAGRLSTTLGVCVTSVRQSLSGGPQVEAVVWRRLAAVLIRTLDERPNARIRVVVLRGGNREDDWTLSKELYDAISSAHPGRSEFVPYTSEPYETLSRIAECDAFIATRYHASVFAYLAGCNLMLLVYHRKVRDLAREIGLSDSACVTLSENLHEGGLQEKINRLMDGNDDFRARLSVADASRRAWLNIQTLGESG